MSLLLALFASQALAGTPWECEARTASMTTKTVIDTDGYLTFYDVAMHGWNPSSLLDTWIESEGGCLNAWFSVTNLSTVLPSGVAVGDDYAAFLVTIDGNPLWGHISGCTVAGVGNQHCVVYSHAVDGATTVDGHSYHFFYPVAPGKHHVEVWYAGLDATGSMPRGAYVGGSNLTLQYQ